jgi:hypothetical protein
MFFFDNDSVFRDRIHDLDSFQDHMKIHKTPDAMLAEWSLI